MLHLIDEGKYSENTIDLKIILWKMQFGAINI